MDLDDPFQLPRPVQGQIPEVTTNHSQMRLYGDLTNQRFCVNEQCSARAQRLKSLARFGEHLAIGGQ